MADLTPEQARANREHCLAQCRKLTVELRAVCAALAAAEEAVHDYSGERGYWWSQRLADMHQQARDAICGLQMMVEKWTAKGQLPVPEEPEAPDYGDFLNIARG